MKKILVVEDDNFLINAYRVKLTKAGFELKTATDGEEALAVLKTFAPDIILLDIVMPKLDGFEVLKIIKADPNTKNIPVIITSNLGQGEDIQKGKALGATDYMVKSDMSLDEVVKKVNSILGQ